MTAAPRHSRARFTAAGLLVPLLLAAAPATPAAPANRGDETAAVKASVRALSDAMGKGDAAAVKAAVVSDARIDRLLDAMCAAAAANRRFNDLVTGRWGKEVSFDYAEELNAWTAAGDDLEQAEVFVLGDVARLAGGAALPPLRKTGRGWKVDLTAISEDLLAAAEKRIPSLEWMAWALDETSKEVSAGKHQTAPPAHKAVAQRLRAVSDPVESDPAEAGKDEGDDARAARATAKAMVKALLAGEAKAVSELYGGKTDVGPALEVFTALRSATVKLHRSLGQRFPSLVQGSKPDQVDIGPDLLEAIDAARVTVGGEAAFLKLPGDWEAMMLRRSGGGRWKVTYAPSMERFLLPARATAAALEHAAGEVQEGKYTSARAFRAALAEKVQSAVEQAEEAAKAKRDKAGPASAPAARPGAPRGAPPAR